MAQIIHRNRRRDHRRALPVLEIRLEDVTGLVSRDWSLGGFAASGSCGGFLVGEEVVGGLRVLTSKDPWLDFSGTVARLRPGDGFIAVHFTSLSPPCFALLETLWRRPLISLVSAPCWPRLVRW